MTVAYFLDKNNFEIKNVVEVQDYEINLDEETNAKSSFTIVQETSISDKDFVFLQENGQIKFIGVIEAPSNEEGGIRYDITAKYITNLFDRDLILKNQTLISSTGIEDFIEYTIKNEFTHSTDTLLNKTFLDVEVLTHTPKKFSVSNENGIYNFHTFINNMTQNYNIVYDFIVENGRLKMTIKNIENENVELIDCNVSDILNYSETFSTNIVAKVTVLSSDGSEYNLYLLNDRTTTEDGTNENRAVGDVVTKYEQEVANVRQAALQEIRSNSYKHLVEFTIANDSTLYNVKKWRIGRLIKIKTKQGEILDSYISALSIKKDSKFIDIKTGNIRVNFIDKLKQEKNK